MRLALVSLNQAWQNKVANSDICEKYFVVAKQKNVELIAFPEMTLTGFSNNIAKIAEDITSSETVSKFALLAKRYSLGVIFGAVLLIDKKAENKCIFIDEQGNQIAEYTKIHPFSFSDEHKFFNAGSKLSIAEFGNLKIGLTICYDLRFPELYSSLGSRCDLIINIANWPKKRIKHWNILLQARAIENQIFVAGVNRIGIDGNNLEYIESSNIFDADGEMLQFEQDEDMKIYQIDTNLTKEFKCGFNTTNDRKTNFYRDIL